MSEAPPLRAFGSSDGDLQRLAGRTIAFIGYRNQGRAQALNLRDSLRAASLDGRVPVIVSALRDETWRQAEVDGFAAGPVEETATVADTIFLLIPDEVLPAVFRRQIAPHLKPHDLLVFATGYNLAFGNLEIAQDVDVTMLAPRMIGRQMRRLFEQGNGFYSYVSVERDASGAAWPVLLALARGIGTLRPGGGAIELSARDEAVLDLFHEQGFGAIFGAMMLEMMRVGMDAGLPPEALALDFYLSGEIAESMQAMAELGFVEQSYLHSRTSQYGGMTRSLRVDREPIRRHLEEVMREITSGDFAREWAAEQANGAENFERLRDLGRQHNPFTPIEQRLRELLRRAHKRGA